MKMCTPNNDFLHPINIILYAFLHFHTNLCSLFIIYTHSALIIY